MVRIIDCPDMTLDVYHGRKTIMQQQQQISVAWGEFRCTGHGIIIFSEESSQLAHITDCESF